MSVTWYTWLEQGRGGPPSDEVLERLAHALELDAAARELLFLLARHRPPPRASTADRYEAPTVSSAVQRVLEAMRASPAIVKTPTWDIVAWNAAAATVLTDYELLPVSERNVLRRLFSEPADHPRWDGWESDARFALAAFRLDATRAGQIPDAVPIARELLTTSADFRRLWAENDVRSSWTGLKRFVHPIAGPIALEYSTFAVDGADGLSMVVFTPCSADDEHAIASLRR